MYSPGQSQENFMQERPDEVLTKKTEERGPHPEEYVSAMIENQTIMLKSHSKNPFNNTYN